MIRCERGTALIEFVLVAPILILMLLGMISYGGYFWRCHSLQQTVNDAARAAIAGLTAAERAGLARSTVAGEMTILAGVDSTKTITTVTETATTIRVDLDYNAASDMFFHLGPVPMPATTIRRSAVVLLGGL